MKKIRFKALVVAAVMSLGMFAAGCGNTDSSTAGTSEAAGTAGSTGGSSVSGTVSTDGSTSMEKVIGLLSEDYMNKNSGVKVTYNPTGSSAGIQAVSEGRCDIGLSSRDLKDDEKKNLDEKVLALDGIAIIVNKNNKVNDLTMEQIADIYTGKITNWKDVGGADGEIVTIGREAASGTRDGFESVTGTKDKCKYANENTSTGEVITAVSANENAIGYDSLASVDDTVNTVKVGGVEPSEATILDGTYKIQRDFVLVTPKDKELSAAAKAFYDYATSKEADELITKAGAVPASK